MPKATAAAYSRRALYVMLIASIFALIASFVLSLEKIHLLQNPDATLSCSFNLVLNCATVMQTWQSAVFFNIPNMYIGLISFPVLITVAVAGLGGAVFRRSFLIAMNIGVLLGTIFAYWLFFQSVYAIQVLCPWCLVVTFTCTLILASVEYIALSQNVYGFSKSVYRRVKALLDKGYLQLLVAVWVVFLISLVFIKFGEAIFA